MNRATLVCRPENSDDLRRKMLNTLLAVVVVLVAILVVGCGGQEGKDDIDRQRGSGNQTIGPIDTGGAAAEMPGSSTAGSSLETQTITVTLKDGDISMPTILKPGPTTFNVVNAGTQEHSLRIEGAGQEAGLGADLDAGGAASMEVDLTPGTYTARCPVDDHNVSLPLTVQP
jgi:uncharacterized cupredoxin-like copper-binding protein